MEALNNLLNRVNAWNYDVNPETKEVQGQFKTAIATRLATVVGGGVLGVAALAQNIFLAIREGLTVPYVILTNAIYDLTGSDFLQTSYGNSEIISAFVSTVYRIITYAIGTFSSITLGWISPDANFKLHCFLNLANNDNYVEPEITEATEVAESKQREQEMLKANAILFEAQRKEDLEKAAQRGFDAAKRLDEDLARAAQRKKLLDEAQASKAAQELAEKNALMAQQATAKKGELDKVAPTKKQELETAALAAVKKTEARPTAPVAAM